MYKCDNCLWDSNYWYCCYGNKVINNACNISIHDLSDTVCMPEGRGPWAYTYIHIRQIPHAHVTTITYILFSDILGIYVCALILYPSNFLTQMCRMNHFIYVTLQAKTSLVRT